MASSRRNRSQLPLLEPNYDDLEVRCTWSGEIEQKANIRLSIEVHCAPNTRLQLLDVRGPNIILEHYALEKCLPQTENDSDYWDDLDTPQSPLFGFSPLGGDATYDFVPSPSDSSVLNDIPEPQFWPALEQSAEQQATIYESKPALGSSLSPESITRPPPSFPDLELDRNTKSRKRSATDADLPDSGSDADNEQTRLLKETGHRKARQLSPAGSTSTEDRATERTIAVLINQRETVQPRSPKKTSPSKTPSMMSKDKVTVNSPTKATGNPMKSRSLAMPNSGNDNGSAILKTSDKIAESPLNIGSMKAHGLITQDGTRSPKSPSESTGSPKSSRPWAIPSLTVPNINTKPDCRERLAENPVRTQEITTSVISNENISPRIPDDSAGASAASPEKPKVQDQSIFKGERIRECSPQPTSINHFGTLETPERKGFADTAVGFHLARKGTIKNKAPVEDSAQSDTLREPRVHFQIPNDAMTAKSVGSQSLSSAQNPMLDADLEPRSIETSTSERNTESYDRPGTQQGLSCLYKYIEVEQVHLSEQPEIKTTDNIVILQNSGRVQPAFFKVTITASISMMYSNEEGWIELEIPGIPKTRGSKTGLLLFLMPEDHGLEIRTTTINRATIVENCLVAEFVNTGDLVIPVRLCDRECCGVIRGFTVEQEIVSTSIVKQATTEDYVDQSVIRMKWHALCSLRLHNRCYWTDKCIVYLYVDGGPQGYFRCDLTNQKDATKKIFITAKEGSAIGVSQVRVTCSPKDLDRLYVRWATEFQGTRATHWIPRIYSTLSDSREDSRDRQRDDLIEVLSDPLYLCSGVEATEAGLSNDKELNPSYEPIDLSSKHVNGHMSLQPALKWPTVSRIEHAVQLRASRCNQKTFNFLKQILAGVLCLMFLRLTAITFARFSPTIMQATPQIQKQIDSTSLPSTADETGNGQRGIDQEFIAGSLSIRDRYRVSGSDDKAEVFVKRRGEQNKDMKAAEGDQESTRAQVSFRDRIDYWLGWTGPL